MRTIGLLDERTRLGLLFGWLFILWLAEFGFPLVRPTSRKVLPNILLTFVLIGVNLFFVSSILALSVWAAKNHFGLFNRIEAGNWTKFVTGVILLDFWAAYVVHVLLHKAGWLWRLHSVHHSDPMVDVTTAFRQHPLESVLRIVFQASGMLVLGLPLWVLVAYQTLASFNAQLEHANLSIPPALNRVLQWVLVTPNYHKIHHSRTQTETDSNYANLFSLWDRLFGTLSSRKHCTDIAYGLDYLNDAQRFSFVDLLRLPFRKRPGKGKAHPPPDTARR